MIRDLLNPSSDFLDLREDYRGVQVAGLTEYEARDTSHVMEMLSRGNKERMCEPTAVNKTSSRSHAVLQVIITYGKLIFVSNFQKFSRLKKLSFLMKVSNITTKKL